jgi:Arc/MetJ family transcription regulator
VAPKTKKFELALDPEILAEVAKYLGTETEEDTVNKALETVVVRARIASDSTSFPALTRKHVDHMSEHGDE